MTPSLNDGIGDVCLDRMRRRCVHSSQIPGKSLRRRIGARHTPLAAFGDCVINWAYRFLKDDLGPADRHRHGDAARQYRERYEGTQCTASFSIFCAAT
jgi:hypothetical protein